MKFRFPIIIIDEDFRSENTSGLGIRALAKAIEDEGMEVLGVTSYGDLSQFAQQQVARLGLHPVDRRRGIRAPARRGDRPALRTCAPSSRRSASATPTSRSTCTAKPAPRATSRTTSCASCTASSTCSRTRRSSSRATSSARRKSYLDGLAPPFFRALVHYAQDGSYSWHCPGHSGGVAFLKSPVGQMFHQFFGENMLRADVCNAVDELGQLLDHTGPGGGIRAQCRAHLQLPTICFFVTNGTSTSNKMVWHSTVAPGDIVVVDRNCHKSILHAIIMTGAIPVFLMPTRNHLGIIGPIPLEEFSSENIQKKIEANPFAREAKNKKPRILTHHAEHLRRHGLQRRDDQGNARRQDRHAAFRRSLAAARDLPRFLQGHARDRQGPAARQGRR